MQSRDLMAKSRCHAGWVRAGDDMEKFGARLTRFVLVEEDGFSAGGPEIFCRWLKITAALLIK